MSEIKIRDEFIKLGQAMKLAGSSRAYCVAKSKNASLETRS